MNPTPSEQAKREIAALALPQIVLDAFDGRPLPYHLDIQFGEPYKFLALGPTAQAQYGTSRLTPLWECHSRTAAYCHDPQRQGYLRFDIERPEEVAQCRVLSWQQFMVKEFSDLWELEWPDDRLREVAGLFGFKFIDALIDERSRVGGDWAEGEPGYESFLERIEE